LTRAGRSTRAEGRDNEEENMKKEISNLAAIRTYFQKDGGRKVEMAELKALTPEERDELGKLSKEMLSESELYEEIASA
jgi:hypothetical protein